MPWTGLPKQTNNKVVIISDFMMYLKPSEQMQIGFFNKTARQKNMIYAFPEIEALNDHWIISPIIQLSSAAIFERL